MSGLNIGATAISRVYAGTVEVTKVYVGTSLAWSSGLSIPAPVSHFDFHEGSGSTAADIMGNAADLVAGNSSTAWSGENCASAFSGPSPPALQGARWTACFDTHHVGTGPHYIYYGYCAGTYFYSYPDDGRMSWYPPDVNSSPGTIVTGENRLVWVRDSEGMRLYAGGVQVASGDDPGYNLTGSWQVALDGSWPAGDLIRAIRIWDTALTADQVAAL